VLLRRGASRRRTPAAAALCALALCCALPASASAKIVEQGGVKLGVQQRNAARIGEPGASPTTFENPTGKPVLHAANTYAIYWDPEDIYDGDWQGIIDGFLASLAASNGSPETAFALEAQYRDATGKPATVRSSYRGSYTDTNAYPIAGCTDPAPLSLGAVTCLTDAQIRTQLETFISEHGLPKGMGTIYYILTPPGVTVCLDAGGSSGHCSDHTGSIAESRAAEEANESYRNSFCSYHGAIAPTNPETGDANTILYGMIPWTAGGKGMADVEPELAAYDCQDGGFEWTTEGRQQKEASPDVQEPHQAQKEYDVDGDFDQGLADVIVNQIAVEQQNIVTDPLLNAWHDAEGYELTDECRNEFWTPSLSANYAAKKHTDAGLTTNEALGAGAYYVNDGFLLGALKLDYPGGGPCQGFIDLSAQFTAPGTVNAGEVVGFDGMESAISLDWAGLSLSAPGQTYATYKWNFGDGTPEVEGDAPGAPACSTPWLSPCAASVFHAYQYGGTYYVTLTVTDTGGNGPSVTHRITVEGPPPPSGGGGSGGSTSGKASGSGSSGSGSGKGGSGGSQTYPAPTARAAATSGSLLAALRHGLKVSYEVNEQVAGTVQAIIPAKLAHRLHIRGRLAQGLPAGSPRSVVIGHAVLVTSKGGRGALRLRFPKATARALRRMHRVTITLRMVLRNAEASHPKTTTLISRIVLRGGRLRHRRHARLRRSG
jgi:hypothetical protein